MRPEDVPPGPVLVDTGVVSWFLRDDAQADAFRPLLAGRQLAIAFPTIGELYMGADRANWGTERRAVLETAIRGYVLIPIDDQVARAYGRIAAVLREQTSGGKDNDLWIAASALAQDPPMPVATNDLNDFSRFAAAFGLVIVHPDI